MSIKDWFASKQWFRSLLGLPSPEAEEAHRKLIEEQAEEHVRRTSTPEEARARRAQYEQTPAPKYLDKAPRRSARDIAEVNSKPYEPRHALRERPPVQSPQRRVTSAERGYKTPEEGFQHRQQASERYVRDIAARRAEEARRNRDRLQREEEEGERLNDLNRQIATDFGAPLFPSYELNRTWEPSTPTPAAEPTCAPAEPTQTYSAPEPSPAPVCEPPSSSSSDNSSSGGGGWE